MTEKIARAIREWYWLLLLIISLTATAFYAAARMSYSPVYQSYASLTPSLRDSGTADEIEAVAKELAVKAEDGSLAAALAGTVGADVNSADIRFVADGINLAVSVRASSAELSYETLRAVAAEGVKLLDEERDYELVLVSESGVPQAVTNPLNADAETQRGVLVGAAFSVIFLIAIALRGKKKNDADEAEEPEPAAAVEAEPEPVVEVKAEPVVEPVPVVRAEPAPVVEPEPVVEAEPVVEPEQVVEVKPEPEPEPVAEPEPEPAEERKAVHGGIPADLANFASALGAVSIDIPAATVKEEAPVEQEAAEPAEEKEEAPEAEIPAVQPEEEPAVPEEAPKPARDEEEYDPTKTTLSREMWEIAKEMGMLDDFRI